MRLGKGLIPGIKLLLGWFASTSSCPRLRIAMYNFGSPRVGNKHFTTLFDQRVPNAFRVIYEVREAEPEQSCVSRNCARTPATRRVIS